MQEVGLPNREEWKGPCDPKFTSWETQMKILKWRKLERAAENGVAHVLLETCSCWIAMLLPHKFLLVYSREMLVYTNTHTHTHTRGYVARDLLHLCFMDVGTCFGISCSPSPSSERTEGREERGGPGLWHSSHLGSFSRAGPGICLAKPQATANTSSWLRSVWSLPFRRLMTRESCPVGSRHCLSYFWGWWLQWGLVWYLGGEHGGGSAVSWASVSYRGCSSNSGTHAFLSP